MIVCQVSGGGLPAGLRAWDPPRAAGRPQTRRLTRGQAVHRGGLNICFLFHAVKLFPASRIRNVFPGSWVSIDSSLLSSNTQVSFYHGFAVTWKCLLQHNTDAKSRYAVLKQTAHLHPVSLSTVQPFSSIYSRLKSLY